MAESPRKIPRRDALEVYVSEAGYVCFEQERPLEDEPSFVVIHPSDVPTVIKWLEELRHEALEVLGSESSEDED